MEQKPGIENKINEVLNSAKSINAVEAPPFFTEKTVNKLRASVKKESSFSGKGLLRIAAVIILLVVNAYTIEYILNPKQDNVTASQTATVKDLVSDYQTSDAEITFENKINNE